MTETYDLQKPQTAYRKIGEAAQELMLPAHVLRFWEAQFSQLRPMKRKGGRRYYSLQEIRILKLIKFLLREKNMSIKEVKTLFLQKKTEVLLKEFGQSIHLDSDNQLQKDDKETKLSEREKNACKIYYTNLK